MVDHQSTTGTSRGPPPGHLDLGDTDEQKAWRQLVGQRVCISGVKQGTLRYFGRTNFAQGHWCGIELDEPVGKNDGTVSGVVYFACRPNHGIFAPVGKVSRLNDAWKPDPSENDQNDLASSSSWRSKEPSCDPKYWEFNLDESTEKKFIKNSISDPTFMQGNVKAAIPRGSESFSFDKRDFVESSKTYAKSSVKHSSSSRSLSKYGYSEKNQYLRSNVITQGNNISQIQSKKHNNENGSLTNTMEPYEKFLKTPTNSGQASPTSSENPVGKRFNEMPLYDYGKMPDTFLNSFQPNDFSDFEDEVDNDDQMSVDYDESLGILTPSQMKELTMGSDFPTSLSDIRGLDFPSSESFDDINDLPEDEQVHDVSVFRVSEPSTARILQISKQNGASHYNKNIKGAIAEKVHKSGTDKFLCSKSPNNVENFNFDPRFTSTASEEFRINSIDNFSHTYNVKDITTANVLCSEKASNSDEQITEKYYMYSKEESSNVLRMQSSSELHSNVNIAQLPEADHSMMDIDQKSVSSSNQSDNKNSKEILENEIKLCQTVDTLHSVELESNTTLKEKLTVSWEDCLSRDSEIFQPVERPESVYTIGSSDTGFHEDGESEVGMTTSIDSATDEAKRFSSASRDSCIIVSDEADVYKIAESNSTSGYSTGLSDSCCNDRDDLSSKPLTDEEVQDSVEHCDSEDAFSFQENSLGQDGDMVNMETSDITTENVTAVDNKDSTSDALCETMVEDSTLTEINELLMSPEDKTLKSPVSGSNEMEVIADQQQLPMKEIVKQQDSVESKISPDSPAQSTPERRSNTTRTRLVTSTQNTSTLNRTSRPSRDEVAEKKRQQQAVVPKSPKKNVMSKIKAMIEATSCKNVGKNSKDEVEPTVSTRRTASAPKKSRWDAVTSKIAASLAEEKTKPKTRREIKSRVNTNLTSVRQQPGSCKAPNLDSGRASNCGDGTMSPASVCSRDKRALVETKSAPNSLRESRSTLARDSKQRPKSPRPGGRLTSSRCASPDVAASESSTSASLRSFSHNSKSKTASHWKGSNSTIASSVPPANKRPPPLSATKSNSSTTRSTPAAARPINKKPPATVPKIRITFSDRSQSPAPPKKIDRTKRHTRSSKEHVTSRNNSQLSSSKPVRPPLWLSKAELSQEIQRLGTLCEARTKELNRLKMETRHVTLGFDAFASLFKYMVEDVNGLSVPKLSEDLEKTLKQLELAKQDLAYYEKEVEEMKAHHCQELNDLSNKLFEVFHGEVTELGTKHQEEINRMKQEHELQLQATSETYKVGYEETQASHEAAIKKIEQELIIQREELQLFHEKELQELEQKHCESSKTLQEHIEQLQKKCAELKQHSLGMEDAMKKDTDSKLQWVTSRKGDLEKEVESLKAVLEMKNKELHTLRVQTLEMEKQLEDLPLAREKIKMLTARAEDLEALMAEKTLRERTLSTQNQTIRDTYEKESKVNKRLSMENEELQWRLRQAEQSLITASFSEVVEEEPGSGPVSPAKSPLQMSRSVFFTFVDREAASPRSPYKKITPGFSSAYKAGSKSSAPSPRRGRGVSEPMQPSSASTPKRVPSAKKQRQRAGTESQSMAGSMVSSVGSECSVFDQKEEEMLEEHKEEIMKSLEILREQRCSEENEESPVREEGCSEGTKMEEMGGQVVASEQNGKCIASDVEPSVEMNCQKDMQEYSGQQQTIKPLDASPTEDIPSQKDNEVGCTGEASVQNGSCSKDLIDIPYENKCNGDQISLKNRDSTTWYRPNSLEGSPEQTKATITQNVCFTKSPNENGSDPVTPSSTSTSEGEEMTRSTDFSDMKTYYHMTFPVLKEAEEGNKANIDAAQVTHSIVESSEEVCQETRSVEVVSTKTIVISSQENGASMVVEKVSQNSSLSHSSCSFEKVQGSECMDESQEKNRWRTM